MSAVTQEQSHQRQPRVAWSHVLSGLLGHGERWIYISIFFFTKERSTFSNSTHINVFAKSWVEEEFWNRDWNIVRIPYLLVKKWKIEHAWTFCSRHTAMIRVRYMPPHFAFKFIVSVFASPSVQFLVEMAPCNGRLTANCQMARWVPDVKRTESLSPGKPAIPEFVQYG